MSDPTGRDPEDIDFNKPEPDDFPSDRDLENGREVWKEMKETLDPEHEYKTIFDFHGAQMNAIFDSILKKK